MYHIVSFMVSNMYKIDLIATWTSTHEGSLLYKSESSKDSGAKFNTIRSLEVMQYHQ